MNQTDRIVAVARGALGESVIGAYLYGSSAPDEREA
jgi:hypothetical protein